MHYHLFPKKDTFITNSTNLILKNFGGDDALLVGVITKAIQQFMPTTITTVENSNIVICDVKNFNGHIDGFLSGSADFITGSVSGSNNY